MNSEHDRLKYRREGAGNFLNRLLKSDSRQLKKMLAGYPKYSLPHPGICRSLSVKQATENFQFFEQQKKHRLVAISDLLGKFDISIDNAKPDKHSLLLLDAWAYQQWGAIYDSTIKKNKMYSFIQDEPQVRMRSLLFDTSVLLGECYLSLNNAARWHLDSSESSKGAGRTTYNRVVILLPPEENQSSDRSKLLDMEENVFYHYAAQKSSNGVIDAEQKIGRVLAEPVIKLIEEQNKT